MKLYSVTVLGNTEKTYIVADTFGIATGAAINQHGGSVLAVTEVPTERLIVVDFGR
jgi:hypothetical protein